MEREKWIWGYAWVYADPGMREDRIQNVVTPSPSPSTKAANLTRESRATESDKL